MVESVEPNLRDLLESPFPLFAQARTRAEADLRQSASGPASEDAAEGAELGMGELGYLTFQYARILLAMPGVPQALYRRWCLYTAKSAWRTLIRGEIEPEELVTLAGLLGLSARVAEPGRIGFSVPSYVHMATPIREAVYRLAQQDVVHGEVIVSQRRASRLLQEAIRLHLLSMPRVHLEPAVVERVALQKGTLLEDLQRLTPTPGGERPGSFEPALFPPCVVEMRAMMERGENLSHFGRFTLAAFLHRVGADREYIVDCFRGAPDFDEEITRYQVEHITTRDEGKGYSAPDCANVRANGLCFKERDTTQPSLCLDPGLRHPGNYYFRRKQQRKGVPEGAPAPPPAG